MRLGLFLVWMQKKIAGRKLASSGEGVQNLLGEVGKALVLAQALIFRGGRGNNLHDLMVVFIKYWFEK